MSTLRTVPTSVANAARLGLLLRKNGFAGGTKTGWARARQLSKQKRVRTSTTDAMRAWFARHVKTSYPGYQRWVNAGRPKVPTATFTKEDGRGAVAWLLWGGNAGQRWVK